MKKILLFFIFGSFAFGSITEFDFLSIPSGVRACGVGGNFGSMYNSAEGLFYNPSISALCPYYEFSFSHHIYLSETKIQQLAIVAPLGRIGLGFTGKFFSTPEIDLIRNYEKIGSYSMKSLLFNPSLSIRITENIGFGFGVKYVDEKIYESQNSVFLYDTGVIFKTANDIFGFFCGLENYSFSEQYLGLTSYNLGFRLSFYLPKQDAKFNFITSTKIDYKTNKQIYNFGIEHWGSDILGLRIGYIYDQDKINLGIYDSFSFITAGISLRIKNFCIDYAYLPNSVLGTTHNFGISLRFNKKKKLEKVELPADIIVEPEYFSPNNDGYLDNIFFRNNISTITSVISLSYIIKDQNEKIVKVITSTDVKKVFDSFYVYDGKDSSDNILKDGIYSVEFSLLDKTKNKIISYTSKKKNFVIDTTPPNVEIKLSTEVFSPEGDGVNNNIEFNLDIEDNMSPIELIDVGIFTLQDKKVLSYKPIILKPIQKTLSINFLWNGKDETYNNVVPNGEYKIVCLVQDKAGNKIKKEKKFEVKIPIKEPEKIVEREEKIFYIEGAKVILDKRGIVVIYPTDELFIKNTTDINPSMKKSLYSLGEIIKNKYSNKKIFIEGHTDSVGDEKENKIKSLKYAESLSSFFVKGLGIDGSVFEVKGFGEERPVASNKTKSGRAQNRRIEIILGK